MKIEYAFCLSFSFILIISLFACQSSESQQPVTWVKGAHVFQNGNWEESDFYISSDSLLFSKQGVIKDTIDATGKYITPGFVEGHTHNLDRSWQHDLVDKYLSEGILLVRNMTSKSKGVKAFRKHLDTVSSPRVLYSNWGFTSTLGHPFTAYEPYTLGYYTIEEMRENLEKSHKAEMIYITPMLL
ncbi:amidohydrolase family protein [Mesohalobacter halotolerans]|uniref:Amidohydrolase 3 domain-containing protein n=1 Tax=Mesohalobacter halotolerans TaxID=1883405 RepID=A0A4U5TQT8_9FLAO|nr:hypothetical protein [Mesohalobacter halotolerans]TKS55724.1 hypothetical protein FCN74_10490 [Mesohalobacter halotolerans]